MADESMFFKPLQDVTVEDLKALIGMRESDRLDFKREAYGRRDDDVREMLKDISSFANAVGGYLVLGVESDEESRATAIVGIENGDEEESRMRSSCLANIEERIFGLQSKLIATDDRRAVLVWRVPRGTRAPHMITFNGLNQFWRRHGTQKDKMSVEEIREACMRTEGIRKSLEDFLAERRERFLRRISTTPYLFISATPLVVRDEILDIHDPAVRALMQQPPACRRDGWHLLAGYGGHVGVRPSLYGLAAEVTAGRRLEVFRNAHAEFSAEISGAHAEKVSLRGADVLLLSSYQLAEQPVNFLLFVKAISEHAGILEPIVIQVALYNAKGLGLTPYREDSRGRMALDEYDVRVWDEGVHLVVPAMQFPPPGDVQRVAKVLADRIYNAFGFERCPMFDDDGNYKP